MKNNVLGKIICIFLGMCFLMPATIITTLDVKGDEGKGDNYIYCWREGESWDWSWDTDSCKNWVIKDSGPASVFASDGKYTDVINTEYKDDYARWDFYVNKSDTYKFWVRGYRTIAYGGGCSNVQLFWNTTDNQIGSNKTWNVVGGWKWFSFGTYWLDKGYGTLIIKSNDIGWLAVDKILITTNTTYSPNGTGNDVGSISHEIGLRSTVSNCEIIDIDTAYIKEKTEKLSKILGRVEWDDYYGIPKGRFFGTAGEHLAANDIKGWFDDIGIFSYQEPINAYPHENINDKVEVHSKGFKYKLSPGSPEKTVSEFFIGPTYNCTYFDWILFGWDLAQWDSLSYNCSQETLKLAHRWYGSHSFNSAYDDAFEDFFDEYADNIETEIEDYYSNRGEPDFNDTIMYIFNVTKKYFEINQSQNGNFTFEGFDSEDNSTWPDFLKGNCIPPYENEDFLLIEEDPWNNPNIDKYFFKFPDLINWTGGHIFYGVMTWFIYQLFDNCKGIILYDFNTDCYNMVNTRMMSLPLIFINGTVGQDLNDSIVTGEVTEFWVDQYFNDTIESCNVIGTIYGDDTSKTVILSSLYDCWWNNGTTDSAIGMSIVLGIAKYFKENNIIPRYNLKFIAFGGEESGFIGARNYAWRHEDEDIIAVIDLNQLGFEERNDSVSLEFIVTMNRNEDDTPVDEICERTNYENRTEHHATFRIDTKPWGAASNDCQFNFPRSQHDCDTVCFLKDTGWTLHHRDGQGHTEGDVSDYYTETYVSVVAEMILNVTKYYTAQSSNTTLWGWCLVSAPFNDPVYKSTDMFVEHEGTVYTWSEAVDGGIVSDYIFGWDQDSQGYTFADRLEPGHGYWVYYNYSLDEGSLIMNGNLHDHDPISILKTGWNLVGLPGNTSVDKTDFTVHYNGSNHSWSDALNDSIINRFVFGWDRYTGYIFSDTFEPGYGYWVYAYDDCTLLYPDSKEGGKESGGDEGQLWEMKLNINETNGSNAWAYLGENIGANDGTPADVYDAPTPPCSPEPYISAWFNDNLSGIYSSLSKDIRYGADIEKTWNLTTYWKPVGSNNTTVNITWDYTTDKESEYNTMILYDIENDTTIDMLTQSYYNYSIASDTSRSFQILCSNGTLPVIKNVTNSPDTVGFGYNVTVSADVYHNVNDIDYVKVDITYPDSSTGNFTMDNIYNDSYEFVFNDTWQGGIFNYHIWAVDILGNSSYTRDYCFNVSASANISISTIKNSYTEAIRNEAINITDPPGLITPCIGYELLDNNSVLHIWNKFDSYYFNTSSGIQLTNHYDEYWSHNVLMLGYYNNDEWNLIYRTDELSGFNKNIATDNCTYVNATLWKDLNYGGYDFRLAVRYHLGLDDNDLMVIPYIKNLGDAIPYTLGFAWEINDIRIDMTQENDYIEINNTIYYLNETLDMSFTNMTIPIYCWNETLNETVVCGYEPLPFFEIRENISDNCTKTLYLKWNSNLDYKVQVKSRDGEYNAPVILGIKIGTLNVNQSKQTELHWYDASQVSYYFNDYSERTAWATNPDKMVENRTGTYASTTSDGDVELCITNECGGTNLGIISKVEIRMRGYYSGSSAADIYLRPVFDGRTDGSDYTFDLGTTANWSQWYEITRDESAPEDWNWNNVKNLDLDVEAEIPPFGFPTPTAYGKNPVIRVTYTLREPPSIYNPIPANGTTNVSISPMLNITVSDVNNDSLDITWYWTDNISGSVTWQQFGTNNSVGNGTYRQTLSNASVNGQWWYWKINVSDDTYYNESNIFQFYTGHQSKIVNTGSTNISGYLLMQIHYYNTSTTSWVVDLDVINETAPRVINISQQLGLDTIFNGLVNTNDLSYGDGTYRVYAAFRDPDGDVLICDDETVLETWWKFEVEY